MGFIPWLRLRERGRYSAGFRSEDSRDERKRGKAAAPCKALRFEGEVGLDDGWIKPKRKQRSQVGKSKEAIWNAAGLKPGKPNLQ